MKPEAPVTSTLADGMVPQGVAILFDLANGDFRSFRWIGREIAIPAGGQFDGSGERQRGRPTQKASRLGAVEMEKARLGKTACRVSDFGPCPDSTELFDQIPDGPRSIIA